jgi:hypothetical protein
MTTINTLMCMDVKNMNKRELISYEQDLWDILRFSEKISVADTNIMNRIKAIKSVLDPKIKR